MKKILVKLKGTRYEFYFERPYYKYLKEIANEQNESMEDYLYNIYKGSFFMERIKLGEAIEDLKNEFYKEFKPIFENIKEFLKKHRWILFRIRIINWFKKIFKIKS